MSSINYPLQDDRFEKAIVYSVAAHIFVFLVFTIRALFFIPEPIAFEKAVRVDMVALPDKMKPNEIVEEQKATEKSQTKAMPKMIKEKQAINLSKVKDKSKDKETAAFKKLKALENIEKQIEQENRQKAAKQYKGNQLSSGSELKGIARIEHDNYVEIVEKHIRQFWSLPQWLAQKNLKAQVKVRFDESGNIIDKSIYKSSGNPTFDEVALTTVEKSSPVPVPPYRFVKILKNEGILLGFPE